MQDYYTMLLIAMLIVAMKIAGVIHVQCYRLLWCMMSVTVCQVMYMSIACNRNEAG